jgi:hypothetical protein
MEARVPAADQRSRRGAEQPRARFGAVADTMLRLQHRRAAALGPP